MDFRDRRLALGTTIAVWIMIRGCAGKGQALASLLQTGHPGRPPCWRPGIAESGPTIRGHLRMWFVDGQYPKVRRTPGEG